MESGADWLRHRGIPTLIERERLQLPADWSRKYVRLASDWM